MIEIRHGDAFEGIKGIADKSVNLIMIDPPYIIGKGGGSFLKERPSYRLMETQREHLMNGYDIEKYHNEFKRIQPFVNIYIFCNITLLEKLICFYSQFKEYKRDVLVWHKPNAIPSTNNHYKRDLEYCLFVCEDMNYFFATPRTGSRLYTENCQFYKETKHPTEKPLSWVERLLINSSKEGDLVLDCFSGSGTTAVACKAHDRNFIGFEINKDYYEMSLARLKSGVAKPLFAQILL